MGDHLPTIIGGHAPGWGEFGEPCSECGVPEDFGHEDGCTAAETASEDIRERWSLL